MTEAAFKHRCLLTVAASVVGLPVGAIPEQALVTFMSNAMVNHVGTSAAATSA